MSGSRHLITAIVAAWDSSGIHAAFLAQRSASAASMPTLYDGDASPKTPFPYCVYEQGEPRTQSRSSGKRGDGAIRGREIREVPVLFRVHAQQAAGVSGKRIAGLLVDAIMQQFGGSESQPVVELSMEGGAILLPRYVTDFSAREGDTEYSHVVRYEFWIDQPVAL